MGEEEKGCDEIILHTIYLIIYLFIFGSVLKHYLVFSIY